MEYYIAPQEPETDFLKITSPEEIGLWSCCDQDICWTIFDLLYAIYEEAGYDR